MLAPCTAAMLASSAAMSAALSANAAGDTARLNAAANMTSGNILLIFHLRGLIGNPCSPDYLRCRAVAQ
jgi:hypothetical protein